MSFIDTAGLSRFAGKIKDNFATNSAVSAIGTRVSNLETTVGDHVVNIGDMSNKIATMSGNIAAMSSNIATVSGIATSNSSSITNLSNSVVALQSNYPQNLHCVVARFSTGELNIQLPINCAGVINCSGTLTGLRDTIWFGVNTYGAVSYSRNSTIIKNAATAAATAAGATTDVDIPLGSGITVDASTSRLIQLSHPATSSYQMTVITQYATAN